MTCLESLCTSSIHCGRDGFCPLIQPGRQRTRGIPLLDALTFFPLSIFRMNWQGLALTEFHISEDRIQGDMCTHPTEDAPDRCLCAFPYPPISWLGSTGPLYLCLWGRKLQPCNILSQAIRMARLISQGFKYAPVLPHLNPHH